MKMNRVVFIALSLSQLMLGEIHGQRVPLTHPGWIHTNTLNGHSAIRLLVSDSLVFAGTDSAGVYISSDDGASWTQSSRGLGNVYVASLATNGNSIYAGTWKDGIFRSTDSGSSWWEAHNGIPINSSVLCLLADGWNIYAGMSPLYAGDLGGVFRSTDNGVHWSTADTIWGETSVQSLALAGNTLVAGTTNGIYISTDSGTSWKHVDSSSCATTLIDVWALHASGNNFYAGINWHYTSTSESSEGLYFSTDHGLTWISAYGWGSVERGGFSVRSIVSSENTLFIAAAQEYSFHHTLFGVFVSSDSGKTVTSVSEGLIDSLFISSLAISNGYVIAGTQNGIYRRPLSEMITGAPVTHEPVPGSFNLSQNFPNPFNPTTVINYQLSAASYVSLKVYDVLGREVATLVNERENAGAHVAAFNGARLPSGVYFCRISAGSYASTRKMLLMK
ncbi:MAG TPA: T9SS type A sorting domain-containing protein [Candidatus Kryptonia bacterium]